jgi:hypothetical protein
MASMHITGATAGRRRIRVGIDGSPMRRIERRKFNSLPALSVATQTTIEPILAACLPARLVGEGLDK